MPQPVVCEAPPPLTVYDLRPIVWSKVQDSMGIWWMAIHTDDYKALAYNVNAMLTGIEERDIAISHYTGCIARHNEEASGGRAQ